MLTSLRKKFATIVASLALAVVPMAVPVMVHAADIGIGDNVKCGTNLDTKGTGCDATVEGGTEKVNTIVKSVINIFSVVVGIVSVIMIIYGGFKYITSGGDSGNVSGAKNTIIYAIIGLVVVAMAQFIVQFVLGKLTQ